MTHLEHRDALGAVLANYDYFYNLAGELTQEIINGASSTYGYDPIGQLTQADHTTQADESYSLDANGNRVGGGYVVSPGNRILSNGIFNYVYDDEGNIIRKTEIATGNVTDFTWDHRNRLIRVQERTAGGIILSESSYVYDVFDRRIGTTVNGQTLRTVYNGLNAWADFDSAAQVVTRYLFGNRPDEILARWRPGSGTVWHLSDRLGTVRDLVNVAGVLMNHIEYSSFGLLISQTNATFGDRFLFTGREFDFETGLYFYRARYYDPSLGRFISQDPISFAGLDANLYRYVFNSPTNATDPSGLGSVAGYVSPLASIAGLLVRIRTASVILAGIVVTHAVSWGPFASLLATFATVNVAVLPAVNDGLGQKYEEVKSAWSVISEKVKQAASDIAEEAQKAIEDAKKKIEDAISGGVRPPNEPPPTNPVTGMLNPGDPADFLARLQARYDELERLQREAERVIYEYDAEQGVLQIRINEIRAQLGLPPLGQ